MNRTPQHRIRIRIRIRLRRLPHLLALGIVLGAILSGAAPRASAQEADAAALLQQAAARMAQLSSFHFELTTERGKTTIMESFEIEKIVGDVLRPDRFKAVVSAKFAVLSLDIDVIGVGTQLWVTDPTGDEGAYFELSLEDEAGGTIANIINPDLLILQAIEAIQEPTVAGEDEIDGVQTTRIEGMFDPRTVNIGTPTPSFVTLQPMPVELWIDGEGRVLRVWIEGPLTVEEPPDVVRVLNLGKFDEPVEIEPPAE